MEGNLNEALILVALAGPMGGAYWALRHASPKPITPVEAMSWAWNRFGSKLVSGLFFGLIGGLIFGLILMVVAVFSVLKGDEPIEFLLAPAFGGLILGLMLGLIGGLIRGFIAGFASRDEAGKTSPNQGIKLSLRNSLAAFLVTCLTFGLIWTPVIGYPSLRDLWNCLSWGLSVGAIVGLNRGGSAVIKHYALRLVFWLSGFTPFNFIKFLDYCARLILLKKVGGGYIFIHRMLLDYFAELNPGLDKSRRE
jgi:hypothetical protein